jgi:hypothetical protein
LWCRIVVRIRVGSFRVPRAPWHYVDEAFYHVYGRIARGEMTFSERGEAARFVDLIRDVKERDGLTVLAWCVMGNHYHLALRTSSVPLWRRGHGGGAEVAGGAGVRGVPPAVGDGPCEGCGRDLAAIMRS